MTFEDATWSTWLARSSNGPFSPESLPCPYPDLQADGVPLAKTRCFHFAALQFQAPRRLLSQNAQIYEPECHCCGAYLKPLCQEAERLLIVEIKIMFSDIYTD